MSAESVKDPGAHYRGPNLFGIPLDPYRILEAYPNITREPGRHIVKKILRMGKKGIDEKQLVAEIRCCLERWEQMLKEEEAVITKATTPERPEKLPPASTKDASKAEFQTLEAAKELDAAVAKIFGEMVIPNVTFASAVPVPVDYCLLQTKSLQDDVDAIYNVPVTRLQALLNWLQPLIKDLRASLEDLGKIGPQQATLPTVFLVRRGYQLTANIWLHTRQINKIAAEGESHAL